MSQCKICLRRVKEHEDLCKRHKVSYIYDSAIGGFRLRKTKNGTDTRYTRKKFHSHEIELTKILEHFYGAKNVITGYHPLWAKSKKGALLEFDIMIINKGILVEYNGEQHYKFTKIFHKTVKKFEEQKKRDILKAELAEANNYKLIVIKYDEPLLEDYLVMKIGS